ncbi:MAG: hypothetical protein M1616_02960 [Candidatus Thermoplasmatota archaeon]|nr:hypothetical protein [Candidatus Thermoplasmatota archaeon]
MNEVEIGSLDNGYPYHFIHYEVILKLVPFLFEIKKSIEKALLPPYM